MSPQCGFSCGHLPPRTSPIWIYLTPTARTDQHHHNQHSFQLLSISSHFCQTIEILSLFFFPMCQQKRWTIRRGPAVTSNKIMLNFVHINSNTSDMLPFLWDNKPDNVYSTNTRSSIPSSPDSDNRTALC